MDARPIALVLLVAALGVTGCGSQGDAEESSSETTSGGAVEPPQVFARRLAKLLETTTTRRQCRQLGEINERSLTRFPCPPSKGNRRDMAGFEVERAAAYGTGGVAIGGVVDYRSPAADDGASLVLYTDPNRRWALARFGLVVGQTVGTSDRANVEGYKAAISGYLQSVAKRDCKAYFEYAATDSATRKEACEREFAATSGLGGRLVAQSKVRPRYIGGNGRFGFFTVKLGKPSPTYVAISVVKSTKASARPYVVLDAVEIPIPQPKPKPGAKPKKPEKAPQPKQKT